MGGFDVIDGKLTRTFSAELDIDGELTEVPELAGAKRPALLLVNDEDLAYAKIRLDEKSLATAVEHLDGFEDRLARTNVVFAAWDMCRDGLMSATDYANIVLKALPDETDGTVLRFILGQLATAVTVYSAPANREALHDAVASRIFEILEGAEPGSDNQLQVASAAMRLAKTEEQLDRIAGWLEGEGLPEGYVVDAEVRWGIVIALAAAGRIGEAEIAEEYAKDSTSYGQIFSAQARGALPDPAVREKVWQEITGDFESNTVQRNLALGSRRATPESLVPYGARYYEDARAQWDNHSVEIARNMLEYAFPIVLAGRTDLGVDIVALGEKWLKDNKDAAPACVRLVSESVDSAQRAVRAQAVDAGK